MILQQNDGSLEPDSPERGTAAVSLESQRRTDSRKWKPVSPRDPRTPLKVSTKAALPEAFAHLHKCLRHPKGLPAASAPSNAGFSATRPCPSTDDTSHPHLPAGLLPEKEGLMQH